MEATNQQSADDYLAKSRLWSDHADKGGEVVNGYPNHTAEECADRSGYFLGRYYALSMEE